MGAIRAARVNVGDAVWQKPHVLLDSLFDACHSALLRKRYLQLCALCACSAGERDGEQVFALQRIGIEPNGEWAVIDELDLHHRAE